MSIYLNACEEMDWQRMSEPSAISENLVIYYHIRTPRIDKTDFPPGERGDAEADALSETVKTLVLSQPPVLR